MPEPDESRVWEMYKLLVAQCEHFNKLESTYRALASTWLLAAFAGIGFVARDLRDPDRLGLIAAVSTAGALGIVLLWVLDLLVYHRLLNAAFYEQYNLEAKHYWLPQLAHSMFAFSGKSGVASKLVWFYVVTYQVLALAAAASLSLAPLPTATRLVKVAAFVFLLLLSTLPSAIMLRAVRRDSPSRVSEFMRSRQ
jgi:hypothetical protein